jgi:hypothetical protein
MYGSPFCTHTFTEGQLAGQELVTCECGNKYQPSELRSFTKLQAELTETQTRLGTLVREMAAFNTSNAMPAVVTPAAPARPEKPKRERPKLSVTQWLIVAAGFMVLVAASVFVSQNLASWNVYGWSTLELALGAIAGFGAFKTKKFSILLSNFLAVFSSAMLLTLIMSFSTTFGWGFSSWDQEPAWFWALNLATTGLVSLGLGIWSKNFGWRAITPLSLSLSSIVLVINSAGAFEDRWRIAVLSVALFAVLISVRLSRNSKWELKKKDADYSYLKDLQEREDNSLKRFGVGISFLLVGYAGIDVLMQLVQHATTKLDGVAALVTAAVWLVGARINQSWITAIAEKSETVLKLRDIASAIGLSFLGLGVLSVISGVDNSVGLIVAIALLALVFSLERFARALLLPTFAVTIAAWVTATFGAAWYLLPMPEDKSRPIGIYLIFLALVLSAREYLNFKPLRTIAIYAAGFVGSISIYSSYFGELPSDSPLFAAILVATLVGINLFPLLVAGLFKVAKRELPDWAEQLPLAASSLVVLSSFSSIASANNTTYLMAVGSGFLLLTLAGMHLFNEKALASKLSQQTYVALAISVIATGLHASPENLKTQTAFFLIDGLLIFGYSILSKNVRWSVIGYSLTSLSILLANYSWGTATNAGILASAAILVGAFVNLGFLWATKQFGGNTALTRITSRVVTAISLVTIIETAKRFVPLDSTAYWLLVLIPALIAIAIELRGASVVGFIYAGAALFAAPNFYWPQPEIEARSRILVALLTLAFLLVRHARSSKVWELSLISMVNAGIAGYFSASLIDAQFKLTWNGPEIYSIGVASFVAVSAWLTRSANGKLNEYVRLDLPVLIATVPSFFFALTDFSSSASENANRLLFATSIIWAHNVWRTHQRRQIGWLVAQAVTGLIFAWSLVQEIYVQTKLVWDGPELYALALTGVVFVGLWLSKQQGLLTGSLYRQGLPLAVAITPSALYSWSSVTKQFAELDSTEITRTVLVLVIAAAAMIFGILKANRGLNLIGTAELWLIAVPGLWFKTSAVDNGSADLELRGLLIAAVIFWVIALVRKYSELKPKSIVWIGIPVSVALAPAILHTLSSLGGSELRSLDWWRFSIVLSISLTLLIVGSLREIGGTFFPGLIGVLVTVLPYGFVPIANREWFLWAILLGVAGLLVWLAVRLENMRKAGREPSVWLKELK